MAVYHRPLPPLNALRVFEVVGRKLNFRAAAEELYVTQGAVAQQIRTLESYFGFSLFQRLPRGVAFTPQGATYFAEVTRAFALLNEATAQLLMDPNKVTISVTPTFASKILLPQLVTLTTALPGIELRTVATETIADFDRDQVDIAVRFTQPPFPTAFETKLLFKQELVVVASPHLLTDISLPLSPERLQEWPLLHDDHQHWRSFFGTNSKLVGAVFNQTTLAIEAAVAGQGMAIACYAFVQADIAAGRLLKVCDTQLLFEPSYYLVRKRVTTPRRAVDEVWQWCAENLAFTER